MEFEFLEWLRTQTRPHPRLHVGPGDDAASLFMGRERDLVITTDLLTDGVDFVLAECDPRRVGRKALAVNLSDLAAMAARPFAALVSVALPARHAGPLARAIHEGILELAGRHDVALAGGDTNTWDGRLVISVTALGEAPARGVLRRDGARPGDVLLATGDFGGSILGRHFDFEPRVREASLLHRAYELHAGIDVSDGLSLDLSRVAHESHCGVVLSLPDIPINPAAVECAETDKTGRSPLDHALTDGEDFELLLAVPADSATRIVRDQPLDVPVTRMGEFVEDPGLWALGSDGKRRPLPARGWQHREWQEPDT
ncbi:MAG: thiamine-phosphate kinase [Planctomycetota bacterium]